MDYHCEDFINDLLSGNGAGWKFELCVCVYVPVYVLSLRTWKFTESAKECKGSTIEFVLPNALVP